MPLAILFFANAAALRRWFTRNSATAPELVVGYMKKSTGVPSITWSESVDEALCVGWIDGIRHRIDDERYRIRFTPRRRGSHWSNINIRKVAELKKAGRMKATGLAAFAGRSKAKSGQASYEHKRPIRLSPEVVRALKQNAAAWKYYGTLSPGYKRLLDGWIMNAKKAETRARRLELVINACAQRRRLNWGAKLI